MDNTTNFTYSDETTAYTDHTVALEPDADLGNTWKAANNVAMNECGALECEWTLTLTGDDKGNGIKYTAAVSDDAVMLTPSFTNIGK